MIIDALNMYNSSKFLIKDVTIDENIKSYGMVGHPNTYNIPGNKEISITAITDGVNMKDLMETPKIDVISGIFNNAVYIFEDCDMTKYDFTIGDADAITEANVEFTAQDVQIYDDMKIKFKDKECKVKAISFAQVWEEFGDPRKMSYNEFCKKCLITKI